MPEVVRVIEHRLLQPLAETPAAVESWPPD